MGFLDAAFWYDPIWTDAIIAVTGIFAFIGFVGVTSQIYNYYFGVEEKKEPPCEYYDVCKLRSINEMNRTPVGMFSYKMQEYYKKKNKTP